MKNPVLLLFLLLFSASISGQGIQGTILDSTNNKGIPFAFIHLMDINSGTVADEHGHFQLSSSLPFPINIKITALGFEGVILALDSTQMTEPLTISLSPSHFELEEVNITVAAASNQKYQISNVESKTIEELSEVVSPNLSEAITNISGVYNNSTGNGIGKPVIRGLSGSRVITSLNGLRIENQQWGGDHGMGLSELGIAQIDVIKGPSSLLYGPDALGGVIHLSDEKYTSPGNFEANYASQFESNSLTFKNTIGIKTAIAKFRINAFAYYNTAADYQLPNGEYLVNSRWQEGAGKIALGYNRKNWVMNLRYNYNRSFIGLPGHTHDSIVDYSTFRSTQQQRAWILPLQQINSHFTLLENSFFLEKGVLKIATGFSTNHLQEFEEKVTIPGINNRLNTYSYHVKYNYKWNKNMHLISGIQGQNQMNNNLANADEILIPNAFILDNGIYSILNWNKNTWEIQAGVRYDYRILESTVSFNAVPPSAFNFQGVNFSAGAVKKSKIIVLRTNISSGFRPPNLSELMSYGVHHGTSRFEIGNINLKSEYATQADFSVEIAQEHLSIIANPFVNRISNFISISPSGTIQEGVPVYHYIQSPTAWLIGGDLGLHYHPHFLHQLHLESSLSYLEATDQNGTPLSLIPQARINTSAKLQFKSKQFVQLQNLSVQHLYFFAQRQTAAFETSSPAYQLLHIGGKLKFNFKQQLFLKFGIRNILNEKYIDHLSRLKGIQAEAPGRNFYLGLKWNFLQTKNLHEHESPIK